MTELTKKEAYLAMYAYLDKLYSLTSSDDLGGFLGSMSLLPDGDPADPTVKQDWEEAIGKVKSGEVDASLWIEKK